MTTALTKYAAARTALAAAHRVDEVKAIRDKAQAMAAYAKQARDTQMVQWATEIKVRAERRCGELLRETAENGQRDPGGRGRRIESHDGMQRQPTLNDLGITLNQSSRYQKLAAMPEEHFETAVETAKATAGAVTSAHMLRLADELQTTRELHQMLKQARTDIDPVSRANAAWQPIGLALAGLPCVNVALWARFTGWPFSRAQRALAAIDQAEKRNAGPPRGAGEWGCFRAIIRAGRFLFPGNTTQQGGGPLPLNASCQNGRVLPAPLPCGS